MSDLHDHMAAILRTRESIASRCLGAGDKACLQPSVRFQDESRDRQHVSAYSLTVIQGAMQRAGVPVVLITSTYRSLAKQAEVMYDNMKVASMYKSDGKVVEQVGADSMKAGLLRKEAIATMTKTIEDLQGKHHIGCVSQHQLDPKTMNVIDLSWKALMEYGSKKTQTCADEPIRRFVEAPLQDIRIKRVGVPKYFVEATGLRATNGGKLFSESNSCVHIEIPQRAHRHAEIHQPQG